MGRRSLGAKIKIERSVSFKIEFYFKLKGLYPFYFKTSSGMSFTKNRDFKSRLILKIEF